MLALKQFPTEAGNKTPAEYIASVGTPTTYRIVWNHYGHVQPDDDNVVARIKSYKDGVCDLLGINDKNLRLRGVDFVSTAHNKKTFTFIIE